ncbi:rraga protein [Pelomyxa schiedti]|nr:rraga protein [Pelomyxa schiedti]
MGNLVLNLLDCGGQDSYMDGFLSGQQDYIFKNVEVLIYLFDIESPEYAKDMRYYRLCLEALHRGSRNAKVFCLVHKMDRVHESQRQHVFHQKESEIKQVSLPLRVTCFPTSIWDDSLYRAWSAVTNSLISNIDVLEQRISKFCDICEADEVVLYENTTFLVICHATRTDFTDPNRFEIVSNVIKQFKVICSKSGSQLQGIQVRTEGLTAIIENFTANTCVMVITCDPSVLPATTSRNIKVARPHFEKLLSSF